MDSSQLPYSPGHGRRLHAAQGPLPCYRRLGHGPVGQAQGPDDELRAISRHIQAQSRHVLLGHHQPAAPLSEIVQQRIVQRFIKPCLHQAAILFLRYLTGDLDQGFPVSTWWDALNDFNFVLKGDKIDIPALIPQHVGLSDAFRTVYNEYFG